MAIQVIFTPLTGRESDRSVLAVARAAARRLNAHVDVVSLCANPRDAIPYVGEGMSGSVIEQFIAQVELDNTEQSRKAHAEFDSWRENAGFILADSVSDRVAIKGSEEDVPSCSWREIVGASEYAGASAGKLADLIIAPRGDANRDLENEGALEFALMRSRLPVLLAPPTPPEEFGNRVVLAWDGSAEAARAVGAAIPFLRLAETVTAVTVAEEGKRGDSVQDLARYLSWHGVQADTRSVDAEGRSIGDAILGAAMHASADFLVMGAYSHSRYRELIFGGATRYILDECMLPVLLAH